MNGWIERESERDCLISVIFVQRLCDNSMGRNDCYYDIKKISPFTFVFTFFLSSLLHTISFLFSFVINYSFTFQLFTPTLPPSYLPSLLPTFLRPYFPTYLPPYLPTYLTPFQNSFPLLSYSFSYLFTSFLLTIISGINLLDIASLLLVIEYCTLTYSRSNCIFIHLYLCFNQIN